MFTQKLTNAFQILVLIINESIQIRVLIEKGHVYKCRHEIHRNFEENLIVKNRSEIWINFTMPKVCFDDL